MPFDPTKFDHTDIHPLADTKAKAGRIRFKHEGNGPEFCFSTCVNNMTGDRMSWFNNDPPFVNDTLKWVRSVFKDIREKTIVVEVIGDF